VYLRIILRNMLSNWVGYFVTTLVGFFLAPFIVHHLGNTGYGAWTLILSLTGYFGLLDLGIRSSVGRFVARYISLQDEGNVNRTISTAIAILGSGGALAMLATAILYFAFGSFHIETGFLVTARLSMVIAGLTISLALPMGVFSAVLIGVERFDVMTGVTVAGALTRATLIVLTLKSGHGLVAMALVVLLVNLCEYSATAIAAKIFYRPLHVAVRHVELANCRELFGFGIYRFGWIIANQLIFYTDSVVIGAFLGASAITFYAIGGSLITYGRNVVSLAVDTLYPSAARLDSRNDMAGLRELQILGTKIALLISLPLCLGFLFLGKQFIILWMGKEYAISAMYLSILTIPQFTSMSQYPSALILAGMARHKPLAYLAFSEGVINLALSIILVRKIGIVGVAWGTVVPHLINTGIIIPLYTLRTLKMNLSEYLLKAYLRPVLCSIPVAAACYALSRLVESPSWLMFGAEVLVVCSVFMLLSYGICLTGNQRALLWNNVRCLLSETTKLPEAAETVSAK
jgi:O-antigen/teichoic acid export membrane protein